MKSYKLSVLISTVDLNLLKNKHLLNIKHPDIEVIVIQQLINTTEKLKIELPHYKVFSYAEKGISNSRNRAIENATGELCIITDDDVVFCPDFFESIVSAFENNLSADIITFKIKDESNIPFKNYASKAFKHNIKTISKVSSIEICFRRSSICHHFDSQFGLGAQYATGEEYIFLMEGLKSNLNIFFEPKFIVIHELESSGSDFSNTKLILAKGALFRKVFGYKGIFINLYFAIRKYNSYKSDTSFFSFYKNINKGFKAFKNK